MTEPGIEVDHSTVHRWAIKLLFEKSIDQNGEPETITIEKVAQT